MVSEPKWVKESCLCGVHLVEGVEARQDENGYPCWLGIGGMVGGGIEGLVPYVEFIK